MRSMRGERGSTRKRGVLDTVMIVSVIAALVLFGLWFFGSPGPRCPAAERRRARTATAAGW